MRSRQIAILCGLFICSLTCPSYATPTLGLVGQWNFSGNANDTSGNANNGTVNGAALTTDRFGSANTAYFFDGVDDYISLGSPIPSDLLLSTLSISLWVKPDAYANASGDIVGGIFASQWDPTHSGYSVLIDYRSGHPHGGNQGGAHFQVGGPTEYWTSGSQGTTSTALALGTWNHVVAMADPITHVYQVYINNSLVADWIAGSTITYSASGLEHLLIGLNQDKDGASTRYFYGSIDDINVYNRVLSSSEIDELYNAPASVPDEPLTLFLLLLGLAAVMAFHTTRRGADA